MSQERNHVIGCFPPALFCRRVCFCCVFVASFIVLLALFSITDEGMLDAMMTSSAGIALVHAHTSNISKPTDGCKLPKLDPLDASILEYLNPAHNPLADCNVTFVPKTRIRNGRIELIPELSNDTTGCEFRCHYPKDDYHARLGEWLDISKTPDCDVVEVRCRDNSSSVTYEYLHTQIFVSRPAVEATPTQRARREILTRPPDVHLFILDSVASTQFMRCMPKSLRFLEEEMGAINFRYVSKVGLNSRPNAFPLLLGKQLHNEWDYCQKPLDEEPFVGFEFKRRGY
ncbi:Protein K03A11.4 [Aphelenchoides avenae]|nr:Protein K03A11.4 [Aphelenchus avenae]